MKPIYPLFAVLAGDAIRRAEILKREIDFFRGTLQFRVPRDANGKARGNGDFDSEKGPIGYLQRAAKSLSEEADSVLTSARQLLEIVHEVAELDTSSRHIPKDEEVRLTILLLANGVSTRLSSLVMQLGELHLRYEQIMKYQIPDHPSPSVRGLRDSTLVDRYLTELGRQVFRDIANFVRDARTLASAYPFESVPPIFLTRVYDPESSLQRFTSSTLHADWVGWYEATNPDDTHGESAKPIRSTISPPEAFVSVRLPYWLPDCLEYVPVIAHEVAHAVLRDALGPASTTPLQMTDGNPLQALFVTVADTIGQSVLLYGESQDTVRYWATEFVCDLLALARFKGAYLYCAASLTLSAGIIRGFDADSFGESRVAALFEYIKYRAEGDKKQYAEILAAFGTFDEFRTKNLADLRGSLLVLTRLEILASLAPMVEEAAGGSKSESVIETGAFCESLCAVLGLVKKRIGSFSPEHVIIDLAKDLTKALKKSGAGGYEEACKAYWHACNGETTFDETSVRFQGVDMPPDGADYFLWRQRISTKLIRQWNECALDNSTDARNNDFRYPAIELGAQLTDVVWRTRWAEVVGSMAAKVPAKERPQSMVLRAPIRHLIDDYLFRNVHPGALYGLLNQRARRDGAPRPLSYDEVYGPTIPGNIGRRVLPPGVSSSINEIEHFTAIYLPARDIEAYVECGTALVGGRLPDGFPQWDRDRILGISKRIEEGRVARQAFLFSLYLSRSGEVNAQEVRPAQGSSRVLLGRYDIATLDPDSANWESKLHWPDKPPYPTLAQRRVLINVNDAMDSAVNCSLERVVAISLIALASPLAWRILVPWIRDRNTFSLSGNSPIEMLAFLSDGWDQVVVLFRLTQAHPGAVAEAAPAHRTNFTGGTLGRPGFPFAPRVVDEVCAGLQDLSRHPVVGRMETMFTDLLLEQGAPQDYHLSLSMRCRAQAGCPLDPVDLSHAICDGDPQGGQHAWSSMFPDGPFPTVRTVSGLTDYEIRLDSEHNPSCQSPIHAAKELRDRINKRPERVGRLITQVSFRRRR